MLYLSNAGLARGGQERVSATSCYIQRVMIPRGPRRSLYKDVGKEGLQSAALQSSTRQHNGNSPASQGVHLNVWQEGGSGKK